MGVTQKLCKVAVVGAGSMAREHLKAFKGLPGVELVGITSRTRARATALAAEFDLPTVCDSIGELHAATKADLVVVTVTELAMHAVCEECFCFSWAVLMEKPAGYDWDDAVALEGAARRSGTRAWVGLNRRCLSSTRAVLRDLELNPSPRFIHVQDQQNQAAARLAGQPEAVVRNWMYANSIHLVDFLRVFARGEIGAVTRVIPWNPERPGVVLVKLEFEDGDVGLYEGVWHGPGPWAVSVTLPQRRWELRPLERARFQRAGERLSHEVEVDAIDIDFKPGFRLQAELAVAAVRGETCLLPTLSDALATMRLIKLIFDPA